MKIRPFWVLVHRYAGLAMTVFLIIVGLTGSLLAFYAELECAVNPQLHAEAEGRTPLAFDALIERAERLAPEAHVQSLWMSPDSVQISVSPRQNPATGRPFELTYDQLILNPYTGEELGRRTWGAISEGLVNLMPFIYKLHYNLALDDAGMWILGVTALVWTLDCFVGFYLTLPAMKKTPKMQVPAPSSLGARWRKSWTIKWSGSAFRINYDLHRAGGLWVWLALLVFAWSSVFMNLGDTVYQKVMRTVSDFHQPWTEFADLGHSLENPPISIGQAYQLGHQALVRAAKTQDFRVEAPVAVWYNAAKGFYVYSARSNADIQDHSGNTRVVIDAMSGEAKMLLLPTGQYNGNTVTSWLLALHMANVFGMPYRIFVCALGLVIVMLSVTGVVIWLKKYRRVAH
jgi:uncharacterized iron-regulated membrane protein